MNASTHLEHAFLNHFFRNEPVPSPPTLFLHLYISNPTDDDIGTEVAGGAYAPQPITFSEPQQVSGRGQIVNDTEIVYLIATGRWGEISHWGVRDAEDNLLAWAPVPTPKLVETGDEAKFREGVITIAID